MAETNQPNEFGFAGEPTVPQPATESPADRDRDAAERAAVPADDLTGATSDAISDPTTDEADRS